MSTLPSPRKSAVRSRKSIPARLAMPPSRGNSPMTRPSTRSVWSPIWKRPRAPIRRCPTRCSQLSRATLACHRALAHGDVSPKNILAGPEGVGVSRCGVCLVRRSRLRRRVLPQSPAAQMPVESRRDRTAAGGVRVAGVDLSLRRDIRAARRARSAASRGCCRRCCSPASTASRLSNTSRRTATASSCRSVAVPLIGNPPPRVRDVCAACASALGS